MMIKVDSLVGLVEHEGCKCIICKIEKLNRMSGVYIMKDSLNVPIYVGKSINLRDRLRMHIANGERFLRGNDTEISEIQRNLHLVRSIHIILTDKIDSKEKELIKELDPIFNKPRKILLGDAN